MSDLDHRSAFALALRSISPALSALHASHLTLHNNINGDHQPFTPLTCSRCGHATVSTRTRRNKNRTRVLERSCATCTFVERIPVPRSAAIAQFKSTRKRTPQLGALPIDSPASTSTQTLLTPKPASDTPLSAPKRSKKKSGLQELLARGRQRGQQQQHPPTGLSSFLESLS